MIEILYRYLPQTGGRYYFDETGTLCAKCPEVLKIRNEDSKKLVRIAFEHGEEELDIAVLTAVCYLNIKLPPYLWSKITPIFIDGDASNVTPVNIRYKFESLIETREFPGFYYVPYYTGYAIDRSGNLMNVRTGKSSNWNVTKPRDDGHNATHGYYVNGARKDTTERRGCSRHRALCLTFLPYDVDPDTLVSNHKDGVPGNDTLSNLEFVTRAVNNKHAIDSGLTPNSVIPVVVKNLNTGQMWKLPSISEAARVVGLSDPAARNRVYKYNTVRFDDGIVIKPDDGSEWPVLTRVARKPLIIRRIVARNIFTGELVLADNCAQLGVLLGISSGNILLHCRARVNVACHGFNFRYKDEVGTFPNHSEKHLRIYRRYPKEAPSGVVVYDRDGKEIAFHESLEVAGGVYDRTISTISKWCSGGYNSYGYIFKLYKLDENFGPPIRVTDR